jgi:hypothetical protein
MNCWKPELQAIDVSSRPTVAHTGLDEAARRAFEKRRQAVVRYVAGESVKSIELSTGVNRRQLYRLLERAMLTHPDGRPFGFRALVRYTRITEYTRVGAVETGRGRGGYGAAVRNRTAPGGSGRPRARIPTCSICASFAVCIPRLVKGSC